MSSELLLSFYVLVLAAFTGFEIISKVPKQLHTPLMSGSNAISGITIVGALIVAGHSQGWDLYGILGALGVAFAMFNAAGGYVVTDRMLTMFKKAQPAKGKGGK